MSMQGILLSGGVGSRLAPITLGTSKQLLPVYDKPLVYYPLCTLLLSNVKDIVVIVNPGDQEAYKRLLRDGSQWGVSIRIITQEKPTGIPDAFKVAKNYLNTTKPCVLALGDNLLYGRGAGQDLFTDLNPDETSIFGYEVQNAFEFGVAELDINNDILNIVEKPIGQTLGLAIPGFYHFPSDIYDLVETLPVSLRGEKEIVDVLNIYRKLKRIRIQVLPRGVTWLDTGTPDGLLGASNFVSTIQNRQGFLVGSPEEVSWRMGYITNSEFEFLVNNLPHSDYRKALVKLTETSQFEKNS